MVFEGTNDFGLDRLSAERHVLHLVNGESIDITRQGRQWMFTFNGKTVKDINLSKLRYDLFTKGIDGINPHPECKIAYDKAMQKTANPYLQNVRDNGWLETPKAEKVKV